MPQGNLKETVREEVMPTSKKTKFGRKAIEDNESSCRSTEEMDLRTIMIGTFPIYLKCSTISLTLPDFFKLKEMEENLVEVEKEHSPAHEKHSKRIITIDSSEGSRGPKGNTGKTYCGNDKVHKTSLCESTL